VCFKNGHCGRKEARGCGSGSAFRGLTRNGVEHGVAILVLGQVDRQHLGQGGDEVVDFIDVVDPANANRPGAGICEHHRFVQVAVDQRQRVDQGQVVEDQLALAPGQRAVVGADRGDTRCGVAQLIAGLHPGVSGTLPWIRSLEIWTAPSSSMTRT